MDVGGPDHPGMDGGKEATMSQRSTRNLSLNRETVRELSAQNLAEVQGGCNCSDICPALNLISLVASTGVQCCIFT
jgi:hypothetical protein